MTNLFMLVVLEAVADRATHHHIRPFSVCNSDFPNLSNRPVSAVLTVPPLSGITEAFKADSFDKKINLGTVSTIPPTIHRSYRPTADRLYK